MTRWLTPILALASLPLLALALLGQSDLDWNSVRAVIPVAWLGGLSPYAPPPPDGPGALWANIYPPVGFLLQLPAAAVSLLGAGPLATIRTLQLFSALCILGPLLLIAARALGPRQGPLVALPVITAAILSAQPLEDAALLVHIDAPALGLCLLATSAAAARRPLSAALLTTAALFAKQTTLTLAPALLIYLLLAQGRRPALTYLTVTALSALAAFGLCLLAFGPYPFWDTVVGVPSRHPLRLSPAAALAEALPLVAPIALALLIPLIALITLHPPSRPAAAPYLLLSLALLPMGLLGFAKFGGGANNLAFPLIPLLAALVASLPRAPDVLRTTLTLVAALTLTLHLPHLARAPSLQRTSQHTLAFHLLQPSPRLYYFPWLPLSHYLADGTVAHQSWGVLDRMAAGQPAPNPLTPQPPPTFLAFYRPPDDNDALFLLLRHDYPLRIHHPALPGWYVFTPAPP